MDTLQSEKHIQQSSEFYHELSRLADEYQKFWFENTLFHWGFWVNIIFSVAPILIWIFIRKKESSNRLIFSGMFVFIISSWLDLIGVQEGKWFYTGKVLPYLPSFLPWDWVLLPILSMILIQIKPNISPIIKGLIFTSINTFIGEPFFIWLGLYVITDWNLLYSFPIYFFIYLIAHRLSKIHNFEPI